MIPIKTEKEKRFSLFCDVFWKHHDEIIFRVWVIHGQIYFIPFYFGYMFKVGLSPSEKVFFICFYENPLKNDEKCFLFHLKSSFSS